MRSPWLPRVGACLVAGAIGWGAVTWACRFWRGSSVEGREVSGNRGRLPGKVPDAGQLLERLKLTDTAKMTREEWRRDEAAFQVRFAELRKTLEPMPDPGKEALAAWAALPGGLSMEWMHASREGLAVAAVRTMHWIELDPVAAEEGLKSLPDRVFEDVAIRTAVRAWAEGASPEKLSEMLDRQARKVTGFDSSRSSFFNGMAGNVFASEELAVLLRGPCESGDAVAFAAKLNGLPPEACSEATGIAVEAWPRERLPALVDLAMKQGSRMMLAAAMRRMNDEQFLQEIARMRTTEAGRSAAEDPNLTLREIGILESDPNLTLEERSMRLARVQGGAEVDQENPPEGLRAALIEAEAWRVKNNPRIGTLLDTFEEGMITAEEARRQLLAAMPDTRALAPEEAEKRVFQQLMEIKPEQSLALLDGQPEEVRRVAITDYVTKSSANNEGKIAVLLALPKDELGDDTRREAWMTAVGVCYHRYGGFFIDYMVGLPPGGDRDIGLSFVANEVEEHDPVRAAQLRTMVKTKPEGSK